MRTHTLFTHVDRHNKAQNSAHGQCFYFDLVAAFAVLSLRYLNIPPAESVISLSV